MELVLCTPALVYYQSRNESKSSRGKCSTASKKWAICTPPVCTKLKMITGWKERQNRFIFDLNPIKFLKINTVENYSEADLSINLIEKQVKNYILNMAS
jgi:hypothetical protein